MKKNLILMLVLFVWATLLSAQITQEQADEIVWEHIQNEITPPYLLYIYDNMPGEEEFAITTYNEEIMKVKYACWAYYLKENPTQSEPCQHRYLFVKVDDGNLLEVITSNDLGPNDLTEWIGLSPVGILEREADHIQLYPNPTTGELRILTRGHDPLSDPFAVEIFDIYGRKVATKFPSNELEGWQPQADGVVFNISHLQAGIYFVKIDNQIFKIIKN